MSGHVTIVGGGIVGVCSALYLQRAGFHVTLVDKGGIGEGCSFGNAGNISPGAFKILTSHGWITIILASGAERLATWDRAVSVP